jgi:hypothetical protein
VRSCAIQPIVSGTNSALRLICSGRGGLSQRLRYGRDRDIRQLVERRRADLERVGALIFVLPPHRGAASNETGNIGLTPGYWLNFEQGMLVAGSPDRR